MTETVSIPRSAALALVALDVPAEQVSPGMVDAARDAVRDLYDALLRPVRWDVVRPLVAELRAETVEQGLAAVAGADQLQAYASARLAELEVDVRDGRVLYEVLVVLCLVHECARNGRENGLLEPSEEAAIRGLLRALGRAFAELAPDEAR